MAHTKGPWSWTIEDKSLVTLHGPKEMEDEIMAVSPCGSCQKRINEFEWGKCNLPNEANATLIAAAPDMLEALERAKRMMESHKNGGYTPTHDGKVHIEEGSTYEQVLAAINKAKGI